MGVVINANVAIFSRSAPVCNDAQWLEHSSSMLLLRCFLYTIFFLGFPNANPMQLCLFILILCSYSYLLAKAKDKIPKFEASLCLYYFYGTICTVKLLLVEFGKKRSYKKVFASVITCRSMGDILFCYDKQPTEIFVIPKFKEHLQLYFRAVVPNLSIATDWSMFHITTTAQWLSIESSLH